MLISYAIIDLFLSFPSSVKLLKEFYLTRYIFDNELRDPYQSAYRKGHSTETALNIVLDKIFNLLDDVSAVQLVFFGFNISV